MIKRRFHTYPTMKTAQSFGTLIKLVHKAGGNPLSFTPERLKGMTAFELIKVLAPNRIIFTLEDTLK